MPGTLFVVATPIGNLEDISARALRVLREAAVIAAEDTRHTAGLLARYAIATPTTSLHEHNEHSKAPALVARLERGESVALVSDAGMPAISDPGFRLVQLAIEAGIRVEAIPGPSAVTTALVASGLPTESFTFLGFPPTRLSDRKTWFASLASAGRTVIFFEAPHRIEKTMAELLRVVGDVPVAIGRELTKTHEEWVRGPISWVLSRIRPRGEFTVVADLGQLSDILGPNALPPDDLLASEVGQLMENDGISRRAAAAIVATKHGLTANAVYSAAVRAKKKTVD